MSDKTLRGGAVSMWRRWVRPLMNNRGQLNLSSYLSPLLQGLGSSAGNYLTSLFGGSSGGISWPQTLTGLGLTGAGTLLDREPGEVTQARQYLRNLFTSPTAYTNLLGTNITGTQGALAPITAAGPAQQYLTGLFQSPSDPFATGGLYERYLPLIEQQKNTLLNDIQTRAASGLPSGLSPAMGGAELAAIRNAAANQIAPGYQALFADLTRENQARQLQAAGDVFQNEANVRDLIARLASGGIDLGANAAGTILTTNKPDPFSEALARLGTLMAYGGMGGFGGGAGGAGGATQAGTQGSPLSQALQRVLGGFTGQQGAMTLGQVGTDPATGQPIWGMVPTGGPGGSGIGNILSSIFGGTPSDIGMAGPGLLGPAGLSSLSGLLSSLGSGASAYFLANQLAPQLGQNQFQSSALGAGGGALMGFAVGGPIGAGVGGIAGLLGGLFGERSQQKALKEANRQSDLAAQANAVGQIGNFFGTALTGFGVDPTSFYSWVDQQVAGSEAGPMDFSFGGISGNLDQQGAVAYVGGTLLLQQIQQRNPSITSLDQVPGLRQSFIDQMMRTVWNAQNAPAFSTSDAGSYANWAGLQGGGFMPFGGQAIVGERGPEAVRFGPGSMVMPMAPGAGGQLRPEHPLSQLPFLVPQAMANASSAAAFSPNRMIPALLPEQARATLPTLPTTIQIPTPGSAGTPDINANAFERLAPPEMMRSMESLGSLLANAQPSAYGSRITRLIAELLRQNESTLPRFPSRRNLGAFV